MSCPILCAECVERLGKIRKLEIELRAAQQNLRVHIASQDNAEPEPTAAEIEKMERNFLRLTKSEQDAIAKRIDSELAKKGN